MPEYPRFSDFADESKSFEGDKKKIYEILDQDILVLDYAVKDSKQRRGSQYATIQFRLKDVNYIVFSGSAVLIEQLEKYKDNIPFYAQIKKIDKYYTFT